MKPHIYFKSIIFIFSFFILVKLHLGVDLQAHNSKLESELKIPSSISQSTHTKFQGGKSNEFRMINVLVQWTYTHV